MSADVLGLYAAVCGVVLGTVWWTRSEWCAAWSARVVVPAVVVVTLSGLFVQLPDREGERLLKVSFDALRGLKQALLIPTGVVEPLFAQAWAIGNLFVLWPLATVLVVNARWSYARVLLVCAAFDVACEVGQGMLPALRRSFELADIVSNVLGVAMLLVAMRLLRRPVASQLWLDS